MKTILISIISDQTIPNLLFVNEMSSIADEYCFLTTESMEQKNKTQSILNASGISPTKTKKIFIKEDNAIKITQKLAKNFTLQDKNIQYLVNITGGTKLMSMTVFNYFKDSGSKFYYLPIGKNSIIELQADLTEKSITVKTSLSLSEYLIANGLTISKKEAFAFSRAQCDEIFRDYRKTGFVFEKFPLKKAMQFTNFSEKEENIRGTWFEEFIYYLVKSQLHLETKFIASSVMIYKNKQVEYNDNEFDLMFTLNNELYVVECKIHLSGKNLNRKMDTVLYKLGAINKNFGLKTHSYVFTLSSLHNKWGKISNKLIRKCELLNIQPPVDKRSFEQINQIPKIFKSL